MLHTPAIPSAQASPYGDRVTSLTESSLISNLSVDTLKRAGARGELKILKLSPRRCGIWLSELHRYINARAAERN